MNAACGPERSFAACRTTLFLVPLLVIAGMARAQVSAPPDPLSITGPNPVERFANIEIVQHLDAQVPLDLEFLNEAGETVMLGDFLGDRPAVLALVYYECPMLCTEVLNGLEVVLKGMKYGVGKEFDVITVSIDPGETPELAATKKGYHIERIRREGAEAGWHFLTTPDEAAIETLAGIVGFGYAYDPASDLYAHAAGIMLLTPHGKVSKYYYGIDYIPRDIEFGLIEASKGKVGSLVDRLILLCYAYDPVAGSYSFQILRAIRLGAVLTILFFVVFWGSSFLVWRKSRKKGTPPQGPDHPAGLDPST